MIKNLGHFKLKYFDNIKINLKTEICPYKLQTVNIHIKIWYFNSQNKFISYLAIFAHFTNAIKSEKR